MQAIVYSPHILEIEGFLSPEECEQYMQFSEAQQYEAATVETEKGSIRVEEVRNNDRVLYTNEKWAAELWQRIKPIAPASIGNSIAIGLNELFRFYRYHPGQQFKRHIDNSFIRNETEASYYTLLIYLNDNFAGGETTIGKLSIKPKQGSALIFLHNLEHEGTALIAGIKYVLRTDIMYRLNEQGWHYAYYLKTEILPFV